MAFLMGIYRRWGQFFPPTPTFTETDIGNQKGKVFIITGGNAGIGFEMCKMLRASGATIYIASRSISRVYQAIEELNAIQPKVRNAATFKPLHLDLNDLRTVHTAAATFKSQETRLDILWNNAGIGAEAVPVQSKSEQGIEKFLAIHCVAPLLFTHLLTPLLQAAAKKPVLSSRGKADVRVVWLTSVFHEVTALVPSTGVDFDNLIDGATTGRANYARSKAGNWILSKEMARRHGSDGIISVADNPGNILTNMFNGVSPGTVEMLKRFLLYEPKYGAYSELFAGFSPELTLDNNGSYVLPFGRIEQKGYEGRQDMLNEIEDNGLGNRFWIACEGLAQRVKI